MLCIGLVAAAVIAPERRHWAAAGFLYAAAAETASILVRLDVAKGFVALMFVLLIVWVTDSGGYFAGRGIGGPKLWPRVSPKKTWAGAIGGFCRKPRRRRLLCGARSLARPVRCCCLAAMLSIVSQLGDLFESAVKRRFGVKDSSHIIPGHGGLLDRLDGFVAAVVLAAFSASCGAALDGVGRGLMVW